jgi:hypothetical protein
VPRFRPAETTFDFQFLPFLPKSEFFCAFGVVLHYQQRIGLSPSVVMSVKMCDLSKFGQIRAIARGRASADLRQLLSIPAFFSFFPYRDGFYPPLSPKNGTFVLVPGFLTSERYICKYPLTA